MLNISKLTQTRLSIELKEGVQMNEDVGQDER